MQGVLNWPRLEGWLMHTDTTPKEMPTGDANPMAGHTDSQTVPSPARIDKGFDSLHADFALNSHTLHCSGPKYGTVSYWAERWGLVRYLPTIDTARQFLEQTGGRL
jgi:hypothetical protein